ALVEMEAFDRSRKISSDGSYVYLPVLEICDRAISGLKEIAEFEIRRMDFQIEEPILAPEDILGFRPRFEIVGDIALIDDAWVDAWEDVGDDESEDGADRVASALMATNKSIKTVIIPLSDVEGE